MATQILAAPTSALKSKYRLPGAAKRALGPGVPDRQIPPDKLVEIERQRRAFAAKNGGCSFGQRNANSPEPPTLPTANEN